MATVVYTRRRLTFALEVFQDVLKAQQKHRERELEGPKYNLRHSALSKKPTLLLPTLAAVYPSLKNDDDDEYDPDARKRPVIKGLSNASRQKRAAEKAKKVQKAESLGQTLAEVLLEEFGLGAFITLKLTSNVGKALLKDMIIRHGEEYSVQQRVDRDGSDEKHVEHATWEDHFLANLPGVESEFGRKLRNGRVHQRELKKNKRCNECTKAGKRCQYKEDEECRYCVRNGLYCIEGEEVESEGSQVGQKGANIYENPASPESVPDTQVAVKFEDTTHLPSKHPTAIRKGFSTAFGTQNVYQPACAPPTQRAAPAHQAPPQPNPPSKPSTSSAVEDLVEGHLITIQTQFAHPINFKFIPTPTEPMCDFCTDFRQPTFGLGPPLTLEAITYHSDGALIEVSGGYRAKFKPPTKMCVRCALNRLQICRCTHTSIGRGQRVSKPIDLNRYIREVTFKTKERVIKESCHPMCSMCPIPARYECLTKQTHDLARKPLGAGKEVLGCGLLLCEFCEGAVRRCGGKVRKKEISEVERPNQIRLRADMVFLFGGDEENLLFKSYHFRQGENLKRKGEGGFEGGSASKRQKLG